MEMIVPTSPSVDTAGRYRTAPQAAPRALKPPRPKPRSGEFYMYFLSLPCGCFISLLINKNSLFKQLVTLL